MSRYKLTPRRRQSIIKAQKISAHKRHVRAKDTVGYWIAKGVRKAGNKATLGVAGMVVNLQEANEVAKRRAKRKRRG